MPTRIFPSRTSAGVGKDALTRLQFRLRQCRNVAESAAWAIVTQATQMPKGAVAWVSFGQTHAGTWL